MNFSTSLVRSGIALVLCFLCTFSRAEILYTSQPFISPKGSYVTDQGSYHTYRIPGMVVAQDGSLLVFSEGRRGVGSDPRTDANAPQDMVMRRSTDNGRTWGVQVVIDSGFQPNNVKVDFGDPTPVLDKTTGDIFLFYGQWPDVGSITADVGQDPNSLNNNQVVWVRSSSDNGLNWSNRTQILYPDQDTTTPDGLFWHQAEPGPGNGIQLKYQDSFPARNGRLIIPAKRTGSTDGGSSGVTTEPFAYYSDDHGATWQIGDVTPGPDANESEVVELTNGDVLHDARQNSGNFRRRHLSTDGGATWGANDPDEIALTRVDGSMARYSAVRSGHDRDRILFSAPRGAGGLNRNNITVWTSYDEGATFINPVQLDSGFAAYSVVQRMGDGSIGLLYENATASGASYGGAKYINFGVDHLEGADHSAEMSHFDGFGNTIDAMRGGVGWSGSWSTNGNVNQQTGGLEFVNMTVAEDTHRVKIDAGGDMTRDLGSSPLDLDVDAKYFVSLFVRKDTDGADNSSQEFLDIEFNQSGSRVAAIGSGSSENFVVQIGGNSGVGSAGDALAMDTTYFLLAKLVASSSGDDELMLAWYDDVADIPADENSVSWELSDSTALAGVIDSITIDSGSNATWNVDALRVGTTFDSVVFTDGVPPEILGDLTADGLINLDDWLAFKANYGTDTSGLTIPQQEDLGDLNTDDIINLGDFVIFQEQYDLFNGAGAFAALAANVPEPAAILLLLSGLVVTTTHGYRRRPDVFLR